MARTATTTNYLKIDSPDVPGVNGTICFRFKPNWNSNDSADHIFFEYTTATTVVPLLSFEKYIDNHIYAGWHTGGVDGRINTPDVDYFTAGVWANWLVQWHHSPNVGTDLYKDGILLTSIGGAFTPPGSFSALGFGNRHAALAGLSPAAGDIAEWARFDYLLSAGQIADLQSGLSPGCLDPPPVHYVRVLGDASPEPADIGAAFDLVGSPAQATHPTVVECDAPTSYTLTSAVGSFIETGIAANFPIGRMMGAGVGSYSLTGIAATLTADIASAPSLPVYASCAPFQA